MITQTVGYQFIKEFYNERRAERSQVFLMDHIHQGVEILRRLGADLQTQEAYAVHPIFQADAELQQLWTTAQDLDPIVVLFALEYRNIANNFLSEKISMPTPVSAMSISNTGPKPAHPIKLSPIPQVNQMLVADKVQNRKDFLEYHKGSHARSVELDFYFRYWLEALNISEECYQELTKDL